MIATVRGRVGVYFLACLGKLNGVPVTSDVSRSLVTDRAVQRATLAACCGRNFMDELLYPGHLPDGVEGGRKGGWDGGITRTRLCYLSHLSPSQSSLVDVRAMTSLLAGSLGSFRFPRPQVSCEHEHASHNIVTDYRLYTRNVKRRTN